MKKNYSILILKNEEGKYLQYYDNRWNSYLFLNCKIEDEKDTKTIQEEIRNKLDIKDIEVEFLFDKIHTKFSESDKINKEYHHYFFEIKINNKKLNEEKFDINGTRYKYFSYKELLEDERIKKVNSDIIEFINEYESGIKKF